MFSVQNLQILYQSLQIHIFGGPLSLPGVAAIIESCKIHLSDEIYDKQSQLYNNIRFFDAQNIAYEVINQNALIPIRGIKIGNENAAIRLGKFLFEQGYLLTCVTYPTVALGQSMLRLAISSLHTEQQILGLINLINQFKNET